MKGIYVHVPFCKSKCTYCDFASYPNMEGRIESYFACLYREIEARGRALKGKVFDTIYIGGGTPSFVDSKFIVGVIRQIKKFFKLSSNPEITIEINPGTIDEQKVKDYKSVGINRFSIGLQTGYDDQLKALNRIHTAKDFVVATKLLKGANISADVLIGLENQTFEQVEKTIDIAISCGVKHLSVYALTPEMGTPIYTKYLNGELPSDDETAEIYEKTVEYLKTKDYYRYEVSNFAKDGYYSRHNLIYWERGEYVGVGVSASSFIDNRRFTNTFSIEEYISAVIFNKTPEISSEVIEEKDAKFEKIMLALRTEKGLNLKEFNLEFNCDFLIDYKKPFDKKNKYLQIKDNYLSIKPEYLYVQNDVILEFMLDK